MDFAAISMDLIYIYMDPVADLPPDRMCSCKPDAPSFPRA